MTYRAAIPSQISERLAAAAAAAANGQVEESNMP